MSIRPGAARTSFAKTAIACLATILVGVFTAILALSWLPAIPGMAVAILCLPTTLAAAVLGAGSLIVLGRQARAVRGDLDLFLELNESREPARIKAATRVRVTRIRRWLARRTLGHDLLVGDLVEIKSWDEICDTLDESGCLDKLPFMPEMLPLCGRRAYVFRCMHRLFDYRKSGRMRHMRGAVLLVDAVCNGSSHGGCEAACHTIWKSAWLRRIQKTGDSACESQTSTLSGLAPDTAILGFGTQAPHYACQLTQLHAASQPIGERSTINFMRPLIGGNVTPRAFVVGWLTNIFNYFQQRRGGVGFPEFDAPQPDTPEPEEIQLQPGDEVVVRSSAEIRATLNDRFIHRGMGFEPDMLKHCGHRYVIQAEVRRLVDIVTGEMRTMKTPAYILRGVHFSGERQEFNSQYEPLFWRSVWLKRDGERVQHRGPTRPVARTAGPS